MKNRGLQSGGGFRKLGRSSEAARQYKQKGGRLPRMRARDYGAQ